jgi:type VII secretion-associated serine protease mycosin
MTRLLVRTAVGLSVVALAAIPVPASAQEKIPTLPTDHTACLPAPMAAETGVPWAQKQLAPARVWPMGTGTGITVAIVDSGVDANTPQLASANVLPGVDVTAEDRPPADNDCYGHGTFVAGIIAAQAQPGTGFVGVAPDVTILPIRCGTSVGDEGPGVLTPERMADGIRAAVDGGAAVINVSASTTEQNSQLEEAVRYAADRDVVLVASAANRAEDGNQVTYPASYPSVIAVGAVDQTGKRAEFSEIGQYVSLVAPGVDVVSLGPGGPGQWQGSGTSYAAPFVAGAAALVREYHPELSAAQVKNRLEATANRPPTEVPDPGLGWGTVNIMAAVTAVLPEETTGKTDSMVAPPPAAAPNVQPPDERGPLLAVLGVALGAALVFVLVWFARLYGAARKRGWRRSSPGATVRAPARRSP